MFRFFYKGDYIEDKVVTITGDDYKHIVNTLRMGINDCFELVYEKKASVARVLNIDKNKREIEVLLEGFSTGSNEPDVFIRLFQGLIKGSKMDIVVQKCTEIGVSEIVPVEMARSVVKLNNEKKDVSKTERLRKIAEEASKQSKRSIIPDVKDAIKFSDIERTGIFNNLTIVPYEEEMTISLKSVIRDKNIPNIVNLFIGPEGGFAEEEIEYLKTNKSVIVSLGKRILRTETAGLVTASLILYEFDEME